MIIRLKDPDSSRFRRTAAIEQARSIAHIKARYKRDYDLSNLDVLRNLIGSPNTPVKDKRVLHDVYEMVEARNKKLRRMRALNTLAGWFWYSFIGVLALIIVLFIFN